MPSLQSLDIRRRSATTTRPPDVRGGHETEVAKLIDVSRCIGCKACQAACLEWNDLREPVGVNYGSYQNPPDLTENSWTLMRFAEFEEDGKVEWLIRKDGCMHCADPGCLEACPSPGAIVQYANGIVDFISENCIGCGYCIKGCPFNIPRLSKKDGKAYKCSLCSDRVAVGLEPACAKACPTQAISFGSKPDMLQRRRRAPRSCTTAAIKRRGVYDPPGVGGTHVVYVLHHADRPQLYQGLPRDPRISPLVRLWKGLAEARGLAVLGLGLLAGFFHYVTQGPDAVDEADEREAEREIERARGGGAAR